MYFLLALQNVFGLHRVAVCTLDSADPEQLLRPARVRFGEVAAQFVRPVLLVYDTHAIADAMCRDVRRAAPRIGALEQCLSTAVEQLVVAGQRAVQHLGRCFPIDTFARIVAKTVVSGRLVQ